MEPLPWTNSLGLLFSPELAASDEKFVRSSEQLGDDLVASLEATTGKILRDLKRPRSIEEFRTKPDPLQPIEQDPTWFIQKYDADHASRIDRERLLRRIERKRRWLEHRIAKASAADQAALREMFGLDFDDNDYEMEEESASAPKGDAEDEQELGSSDHGSPSHASLGPEASAEDSHPGLVEPATEADWICLHSLVGSPDRSYTRFLAGSPDRVAAMDTAICKIRDSRVRKTLRRELRKYLALTRRLAGQPPSPDLVLTIATPSFPVRTAGGKTSRYVPLD